MVTGTECGLQKWVLEQNVAFKYGYRNKMWIMFWYPILKSTFCSGYHILGAKLCSGYLFLRGRLPCFFYDKILLFKFFTYLAVIRGQNWIQCINKNVKLTVPLTTGYNFIVMNKNQHMLK